MLHALKYFFCRAYTILSIVLFILSYGALKVSAVYYPTDNITNPTCAPGAVGCYVELMPQLSNYSIPVASNGTFGEDLDFQFRTGLDTVNFALPGTAYKRFYFGYPSTNTSFQNLQGGLQLWQRNGILANVYLNSGPTGTSRFLMARYNGTESSPTAVVNGNKIGQVGWRGYNGVDGFVLGVAIDAYATGTFTQTAAPSKLTFSTATTSTTSPIVGLTLTDTQNLVVGTTGDDFGGRLRVVGSGSTSATYTAQFHNSTETSNSLVIRDDGNIGIGTATPAFQFHIVGSSPNVVLDRYSSDTTPGVFRTRKYRGTVTSPSAVLSGDGLLFLRGGGYDGSSIADYGQINFYAAENFTTSAHGTYINFLTTNIGSISPSEKMRLSDTGNLGVGVTSPTAALHLKAGTSSVGTAPLKFNSGTLLATTEAGAIEYDGSHLYFTATNAGLRYQLDQQVTSTPLSSLIASTASTTINNTNFSQEWQWNTLAGANGFRLSSTSTAAASNLQTLFNVALSGANATSNQTTYGAQISNTHTGTSSTNIALYTSASGGTNNYSAIFNAGNVGIGTLTPVSKLQVSGGDILINNNANYQSYDADGTTIRGIMRLDSGSNLILGAGNLGDIYLRPNTGSVTSARFSSSGSVSLGGTNVVTSAYFSIASNGVTAISNLVSCGGVQTNSLGTLSCTSDERLKDVQGDFTKGLDSILSINPKAFSWKQDSEMYDSGVIYNGFIAQNIQSVLPEAVSISSDGIHLQVSQLTLLAASINAIKELDIKINKQASLDTILEGSFGYLAKELLSNASNSITDLYAKVIHSDKIETKEFCTSSGQCLNEKELEFMIQEFKNNYQSQNITPEITLEPTPSPDTVVEPTPEIGPTPDPEPSI